MASRQRDDTLPMGVQERAGTDEQRTSPALDEGCKRCLDVAVAGGIENDELLADRLRRGLHVSPLRLGFIGVFGFTSTAIVVALGTSWRSNSSRFAPSTPPKKFTPVTLPPGRLRLATRPCLTGSLPLAKTIGTVVVAALAASVAMVLPAITATGRRIKFGHQSWQPISTTFRRAEFDRDILAFDEACFLQALPRDASEMWRVGACSAETRPPASRLLRARRERQRRRAAKSRDEFAPPHVLPELRSGIVTVQVEKLEGPMMSALGQKRTYRQVSAISGLPLKAIT